MAALLVALSLSACSGDGEPMAQFEHRAQLPPLEPVAEYGARDTTLDDPAHDGPWRRVGGGLLARAIAVEESSDSLVYVLDAEFLKVAVYHRDGRLIRVLVGGMGRGPGEFIRPRAISVTDDGFVFVLDEGQGRITRFAPTGGVDGAMPIVRGRALQMASLGSRLFLARRYFAGEHAVVEVDSLGMPLDSLVPVSSRDAEIADMGELGFLGRDGERLLFAFPSPGEWAEIGSTDEVRAGHELFPGQRGVEVRMGGVPVTVLPAATRGIGRLSDGRLALYYMARDPANPAGADAEIKHYLALFDADGDYVGSAEVPGASGLAFAVSRYAPEILVWRPDPVPRIVRYRVP